MSEERAADYIGQVGRLLGEQQFEARDKALILAALAQAEASIELIRQVRALNGRLGTVADVTRSQEVRNLTDVLDGFNVTAPRLADAISRLIEGLSGT